MRLLRAAACTGHRTPQQEHGRMGRHSLTEKKEQQEKEEKQQEREE
jgi:hypothetical protein